MAGKVRYGEFETAAELHFAARISIMRAHRVAGHGPAEAAIKIFRGDSNAAPEYDFNREASAFLEGAKFHATLVGNSSHWAAIFTTGCDADAAFCIREYFGQTLESLMRGKVHLSHAQLCNIVSQTIIALRDLRDQFGRPHGNLKPSNIGLRDIANDFAGAVALMDAETDSRSLEGQSVKNDLEALGKIIYGLVVGRPFTSRLPWPIEFGPEWSRLNRKARPWHSLCNLLLDPDLPDSYDLENVQHRLAVMRRIGWKLPVVAVLLVAAGAIAFWHFDSARRVDHSAEVRQLLSAAGQYESAGDFQAANDSVQRALGLDASNAEASVMLNDLEKKEDEAHRRTAQINDLLADAREHAAAGEFDQAQVSLDQLSAIDPGNETAKGILDTITAKREKTQEAQRDKEQAIEQLQQNAEDALSANNLDVAASSARKIQDLDPANAAATEILHEVDDQRIRQTLTERQKEKELETLASDLREANDALTQNDNEKVSSMLDLLQQSNIAGAQKIRNQILVRWCDRIKSLIDSGDTTKSSDALTRLEASASIDLVRDRIASLSQSLLELRFPRIWTNSIGMTLVRINPGDFLAGDLDADKLNADGDKILNQEISKLDAATRAAILRQNPDAFAPPNYYIPLHPVTVSHRFYMASCLVTVAQFGEFIHDQQANNGYVTTFETLQYGWDCDGVNQPVKSPGRCWRNPGFSQYQQGDDDPVVCITLADAQAFCDWLSRKEQRRYRLPTEAEWEYCSRASNDMEPAHAMVYFWGNDPAQEATSCNAADESYCKCHTGKDGFHCDDHYAFTSPVGSFSPNAWGLFDISGDVWELTESYYRWNPPRDHETDPEPPPNRFEAHAIRGGGWESGPLEVRSGYHRWVTEKYGDNSIGFRIVCEASDSDQPF